MSFFALSPAEWSELEAYADNALPSSARVAVEARLAVDATFRDALAEHQSLVAGIQAHGRATLLQQLSRIEAELQAASATTPAVPVASAVPVAPVTMRVSWSTRWRPLVAAATLLLVGGLGAWALLHHANPQVLADRYCAPDPGLPVLMDDVVASRRPLVNEAMNAYKLGDPAAALRVWEAVPAGSVGSDTMLYYRGIFQLQLHQNEAAATAMAQLQTLPTTAFRERADYYFAVALWAQGRFTEARPIFERLASAPDHPFRDDAQVALQQLQ